MASHWKTFKMAMKEKRTGNFVDEPNESQVVDFIFTVAYQTEPMLNLAGVDSNTNITYKQ